MIKFLNTEKIGLEAVLKIPLLAPYGVKNEFKMFIYSV